MSKDGGALTGRMVDVGDGRLVRVQTWGPARGDAVFLMHGTPGSRLSPRPRDEALEHAGVRLICYDRPGFGDSVRLPGRAVAHAASDTNAVADSLGLDSFAVVGRSGGAPHALACAALLPGRVKTVAALAGLAPYDTPDLDWFSGMSQDNVAEFSSALWGEESLTQFLKPAVEGIRESPHDTLPFDEAALPENDRRVVSDPVLQTMFREGFAEALKHSGVGWVDDDLSFCRPWGFDVSDISAPTLIWHGEQDELSPPDHSRWLAKQIEGAELRLDAATGHMGSIGVLPKVLAWLRSTVR
jgi:pimeloyl-ACP methyl ester carboxylesterase